MEARVIRHRDGKERENHKYVARVLLKKGAGKKKNTYRYFYDKEEYRAYLNSKKVDKNEKNKGKSKTGKLDKLLNKLDKISSKGVKAGSKLIDDLYSNSKNNSNKNKAKKAVNKILGNIGDKTLNQVGNNVTKGKLKLSDIAEKMSDKILDTASNTIKTVKNVSNKVADAAKEIAKKKVAHERASSIVDKAKSIVTDTVTKLKKTSPQAVMDLSKLKHKDKEYSKEEDQAAINPEYDPEAPYEAGQAYSEGDMKTYNEYCEENYEYNCSYCTAAYDLRQRGYDVEAMPMDLNNDDLTDNDEILSWYEDAQIVEGYEAMRMSDEEYDPTETSPDEYIATSHNNTLSEKHIDNFVDSLEDQEEGSYGHLFLYWTGGGGHDVVWSIENGEAVIRDCQTNTTYEPEELLQDCYYAEYFRSDNLELADEITRVVQNR